MKVKNKIKVIYIAGEGRSGSTLLERILGQHPNIFAAGELKHSWDRSFIENQLCSCKKPFYECEIWSKIISIFPQKNDLNPQEIIQYIRKTSRIRHYLLGKNLNNKYVRYINKIYTGLYKSILEVTNKEFVIDASKHPVFAHILAQNENIDLYVIHLVRDPRGVAYSWAKRKVRPEITNKKEYMPQYSPIRTAISWNIVNKITEDLQYKKNVKYIFLKYEDFILNPKKILKNIYNTLQVEENFYELFKDKETIYLSTNHTLAGNPMRFKTGEIKLELDEEWKSKMESQIKKLVTIITYPLLKKYKYI